MIKIGTVIAGFEVYGICGRYCIAKSTSQETEALYSVWTIDDKMNLVHADKFFIDQMDAEWEFASLLFPWFQDNVNINMIEDQYAETKG